MREMGFTLEARIHTHASIESIPTLGPDKQGYQRSRAQRSTRHFCDGLSREIAHALSGRRWYSSTRGFSFLMDVFDSK